MPPTPSTRFSMESRAINLEGLFDGDEEGGGGVSSDLPVDHARPSADPGHEGAVLDLWSLPRCEAPKQGVLYG